MTKQEWIEELVTDYGLSRGAAEQAVADDDLWLLPPDARWAGDTPEETAKGFEEAYEHLEAVREMLHMLDKDPAWLIVRDAQERVKEAVRRARERAEGEGS